MAGNVTIPNVFQAQTGPLALSALDANFTALANSVNSVLTFSNYYTDSSGAANSVIVTVSAPQTFAYVAGATLQVKINNTNTGATTINVNALGTKSITTVLGGALVAGQIVAGGIVQLIYDGTNFQLATAGGASFAGGSNTQVQYNNAGILAGSTLTYNNATSAFSIGASSSGETLTVATQAGAGILATAAELPRIAVSGNSSVIVSMRAYVAGTTGLIGTQSNHPLSLRTNDVDRIVTSNIGTVTINAPSSGVAATINGLSTGVDTVLFKASTNSAQGQVSFAVPAGIVGSLLWDNGTSLTGAANSVALGGAAATVSLQTSSANRVLVSGTGNVTINAPTSGTALTSIGVSGQFAISAVGANVSGSSYGLGTQAGFTSADYSAIFRNYGGTTLAYIRGDGQSFFNQNVTIAAPSSGVALSVSAVGATNAANFLGGSSNGVISVQSTAASGVACAYESKNSAQTWQIGLGTGVGDTSYYLNDVTRGALPLKVTTSGNVTIAVPSSGVALTVSAVSGTHSTKIADSANNSYNAGFLEVPPNTQTSNYACVLSDSGKSIDMNGASLTVTIPANGSVAYPVGTVLTFTNLNASNLSIAITTDTMTLANSTTTGTRTIAQNGVATARKTGSTSWIISGVGLS